MTDWNKVAHDHWSQLPHPQAPGVKIGDYPQAVELASAAKQGGHATPPEAEAFWKEFQQTGMQPAEFLDMLQKASPVSNVLHGRPPTMQEMAKFKESKATPSQMREYFSQLPDQDHPDLPAGEMLRHLKAAEPWALMHLGRKPVKGEAAYLYHSGDKAAAFYQALKAQQDQMQGAAQPPQGGPSGVPTS